jgi:hypothetical protein
MGECGGKFGKMWEGVGRFGKVKLGCPLFTLFLGPHYF